MTEHNQIARREAMVDHQIRGRGIGSPAVLDAMRRVPREAFVPDNQRNVAYHDTPLPIAANQTISQPYIVALMIEALDLKGGEKQQLAVGGRLVLPVGTDPDSQKLLRITRVSEHEFETENLGAVRFVPLIGEAGWEEPGAGSRRVFGSRGMSAPDQRLVERITQVAEPFDSVDELPLDGLLERIGDSRLVLLGEASHGTSEFYRARQRITRALIEQKGFDFVAIEGDWPDVAHIDHYVRHAGYPPSEWTAFARFPTWMWRNEEVRGFVDWLREYNASRDPGARVAFHGLDLYSLYQSIDAVLEYLEDVDSAAAAAARKDYDCLSPYKPDPAEYGRRVEGADFANCQAPVAAVLHNLQAQQHEYAKHGAERFLNAVQNARLVVSAEAYYRSLYDESHSSWNLRDTHMFDTLEALLAHHGKGSRGVVWAHNSHLGDSRATEMSRRGELNVGHLCRQWFGDAAYLIGFGTNTGTVAAAADWDAPMEIKTLRPVLPESYEWLCHETGLAGFLLSLGQGADSEVRCSLSTPRLQRAIGVIYRPDTERASHYFETELPRQFDEYIWIDHSHAVTTLDSRELKGMPDTYPFGL
ncbi:MAG TPA: erythromycin esterase family protein [Marinobacter sp.]|nr:erythromycin esterase family protein [Marinobacter sp.]